MMTNTNFRFERLIAVLKLDLFENWKTNLYRFIGLYCVLTCALIFIMNSYSGYDIYGSIDGEKLYNGFMDKISIFIPTTLYFYLIVCASRIMEVMTTRDARLTYMMIPATRAEKFISRVMYVTVIAVVFFIISLFLADITRVALLPLFDVPEDYSRLCFFDTLSECTSILYINPSISSEADYSKSIMYFVSFSNMIWMHSIYILGGCYFRKSPLLKTFGICMGVTILLGIIFANTIFSGKIIDIAYWFKDVHDNNSWLSGDFIGILTGVIFVAFSTLNWGLSYILFKNSEITERKLFRL